MGVTSSFRVYCPGGVKSWGCGKVVMSMIGWEKIFLIELSTAKIEGRSSEEGEDHDGHWEGDKGSSNGRGGEAWNF